MFQGKRSGGSHWTAKACGLVGRTSEAARDWQEKRYPGPDLKIRDDATQKEDSP